MISARVQILTSGLLLALCACGSTPTRAPQPAPDAPTQPTTAPADIPGMGPVDGAALLAASSGIAIPLPNRLSLITVPGQSDRADFATMAIGFGCGTRNGKPGLADLAAHTFVAAADAQAGRPSLQQAIAALGGTVHGEVGRTSTWFTVRVPRATWTPALQALVAALQARTWSRNQLERLSDELVRRSSHAIWTDTSTNVAARFLLGDPGTDAFVEAMMQCDPAEVALFQARYYRPEATVLALQVGENPAAGVATVFAQLSQWQVQPATPEPDSGKRLLPDGLFWWAGPADKCRVLLLLSYPVPQSASAAAALVLLNCLTLDGTGGRLELLQRQAGLGDIRWQSQFVQRADTAGLLLTAETDSAHAARLYELVATARQSLRDTPPSPSEFDLARRRSLLTAMRQDAGAENWLQASAVRALHRQKNDALVAAVAALPGPDDKDFIAAAAGWVQQPMVFAVLGGKPPDSAPPLHEFELLPQTVVARLGGADQQTLDPAADPILDAAVAAVGGRERLRLLDGYTGTCHTSADGAPSVDEQYTWRSDGSLEQKRVVFDTAVVTRIDAKGGKEGVGDALQPMTPIAMAQRNAGMRRHPLALLAAYARGELGFRLIATRRGTDRTMLVVETTNQDAPRLRLCLDQDSSLIRTVETWDTTAEGAPVFVQESWSDYRPTLGLRAPFRRVTDYDDGSRRTETVWAKFEPLWKKP